RALVEPADDRLGGSAATNILADNVGHAVLRPSHDLGDGAYIQLGDIEPGRSRASQIVEVQVADARRDLGDVEHLTETIVGPRPALAVGQDRRRALGYTRQHLTQAVIERNDRFAPMPRLAGRLDDSALILFHV